MAFDMATAARVSLRYAVVLRDMRCRYLRQTRKQAPLHTSPAALISSEDLGGEPW